MRSAPLLVVALLGASPAYAGGHSLGGSHDTSLNNDARLDTTQVNQATNQSS